MRKWIRIDSRGNKEGIDAQFFIDEERIAFPIREQYFEIDYPIIYARPNRKTIETLINNKNCLAMYQNGLPSDL
nr:hypothetical protein [Desulfuribacillus stibiiarsenatis]